MNGNAAITNLRKERTEEAVPVYNFHVTEWVSYFVSELDVYVHNGGNHTTVVPYGQHYERVNRKKVLKANIQYTDSNNYTYTTDSNRRISNVKGRLKLQTSKRNKGAQLRVGGSSRLSTDDGGHLIGTRFNGSGNIDNMLPQARATNRSGGEWFSMEERWAEALKEGKIVEVDITPTFTETSQRPDNYIVEYTIDGEFRRRVIPNQ